MIFSATIPAGVNSDCPGSQSKKATLRYLSRINVDENSLAAANTYCKQRRFRIVLANVLFPVLLGPLTRQTRGFALVERSELDTDNSASSHDRGSTKG